MADNHGSNGSNYSDGNDGNNGSNYKDGIDGSDGNGDETPKSGKREAFSGGNIRYDDRCISGSVVVG